MVDDLIEDPQLQAQEGGNAQPGGSGVQTRKRRVPNDGRQEMGAIAGGSGVRRDNPARQNTAAEGRAPAVNNNNNNDNNGNDSDVDEPAFYVRGKKAKTQAETRGQLVEIMQGRNALFERMADAVVNNRPAEVAPQEPDHPIDLWSRILASRVKQLSARAGRRLMLRMDDICADALDDEEAANNNHGEN